MPTGVSFQAPDSILLSGQAWWAQNLPLKTMTGVEPAGEDTAMITTSSASHALV